MISHAKYFADGTLTQRLECTTYNRVIGVRVPDVPPKRRHTQVAEGVGLENR